MALTYEFIDNGKSFNINFNNQEYTAGKNDVEMVIPDKVADDTLEIRSNSAQFTDIKVYFPSDTITGVGAGSTTATQLRDALEAIFFLDESGSGAVDSVNGKTGTVILDGTEIFLVNGGGVSVTEAIADGSIEAVEHSNDRY